MVETDAATGRTDRRNFIAGLAAAGATALAGCGGNGGDDGDGPEGPIFRMFVGQPEPPLAQYNAFNPRSYPAIGPFCRHSLAGHSAVDNAVYPDIARSWSYDSGTLTVELHEDFYWWDGTNVTAADVVTTRTLREFALTTSPLEHVGALEETGTHTLRYELTEALRETPALVRTIADERPLPREYYGEYAERYEDATTESEVQDLAIELSELREDEVIRPFFNAPFEMTNVGDITWRFTRRTDEDPTPHYVSEINFDTVEVTATGETTAERGRFNNNQAPFTTVGNLVEEDPGAFSFDTELIDLPRANSPGAYIFNCASGPTASVHFRRAFAYLLNRAQHAPQGVVPDAIPTGFTAAVAEELYLGTELLEEFEGYGVDEVRRDAATAAMEAGGFERNSAGQWLYRSGANEGNAIELTVPFYSTMVPFTNRSDSFAQELEDFGIGITYDSKGDPGEVLERLESGNFELSMSFWGGSTPLPSSVFGDTFVEKTPTFGNPRFPSPWEGPPVGESGADASESYRVRKLTTELDLQRTADTFETSVQRLAWVFNQALPKVPIGGYPRRVRLNTDRWSWQLPPTDHPAAWLRAGLKERSWNIGVVQSASN